MAIDWRKVCVLVADDAEPMRKVIRDSLRMMGIDNILLAENGQEALDMLRSDSDIDLVVSDWNMPKLSGVELLKAVRAQPEFSDLPFVMVTADSERTVVDEAVAEGVSQFLIKPFSHQGLQERVKRALIQSSSKLPQTDGDGEEEPAIEQTRSKGNSAPFTRKHADASILIVDDGQKDLDDIARFLGRTYQLKFAKKTEDALEIARSNEPIELILMDIALPGRSGLEACKALKEDPATASIPVIFLTAKSSAAEIAEGFKVGGADYVVKPTDPTVLEARVANQLSVSRHSEDLQNYIDTLIENQRLREEVDRITRHDIKTPVASMISLAGALLHNENDADTTESLQTICQSGHEALGMINRSLDILKMEKGTYQADPSAVDLGMVAKAVNRELTELAEQKEVQVLVKAEPNCSAWAEESLCRSVVRNLLRNAIEASGAGESVQILINRKNSVNLMIHNTGQIPKSLRSRFFRKHVTHGKAHGTGLGTYSARLMTESQGGRIRFISNEKQGTILYVELPAAEH